jgi:hypothetical protein
MAATILPAAPPRRPSRFSRPAKPAAPDTEQEVGQPVEPDVEPPAEQAFAPPSPQFGRVFAPPAPPPSVPVMGAVDRFGISIAAPPAAPGDQLGGYPGGPQGPPMAPPWLPPPPANSWPTAAKIAIGVVVALILVAIAIPVARSQQKPANRPVTLPATLLGVPQLHSAALDNASDNVLNQVNVPDAPWTAPIAAYYGQDTIPSFAVVAAKATRRETPEEEAALFSGVSADVTLTPAGSGPYGGTMECGPLTNQALAAVACASIDSGAFVETVMFGAATNSEAALLSRQIISAVEGGPSIGSIGSSTL